MASTPPTSTARGLSPQARHKPLASRPRRSSADLFPAASRHALHRCGFHPGGRLAVQLTHRPSPPSCCRRLTPNSCWRTRHLAQIVSPPAAGCFRHTWHNPVARAAARYSRSCATGCSVGRCVACRSHQGVAGSSKDGRSSTGSQVAAAGGSTGLDRSRRIRSRPRLPSTRCRCRSQPSASQTTSFATPLSPAAIERRQLMYISRLTDRDVGESLTTRCAASSSAVVRPTGSSRQRIAIGAHRIAAPFPALHPPGMGSTRKLATGKPADPMCVHWGLPRGTLRRPRTPGGQRPCEAIRGLWRSSPRPASGARTVTG